MSYKPPSSFISCSPEPNILMMAQPLSPRDAEQVNQQTPSSGRVLKYMKCKNSDSQIQQIEVYTLGSMY
ncbi:hypothetical protein I79_011132 [Cricetulus griseus]|uniref:Uncharacterized protein n=1 Tax=Cricetulus griseus TaxID=10029 RepID=G3HKB3_CRIGR|nr:hypothetical protein I79_011132 [Cricetulus griseus]